MDQNLEKLINDIVWWIPFKKKRNYLRNKLIKNINDKLSDYDNILAMDYSLILEFRKNIINDSDFINKYRSFFTNLDNKSINIFIEIMSYIMNYDNIDDIVYLKNNKLKEYYKIDSIYYSNIIKLNDNMFAYKKYIIPIKAFEQSVFYYKHGLDIIDKDYLKNKDIIDAGAFIGDSAILLSDYTNKNVYSFEPFSINYNLVLKTIELNNIRNIIPLQLSLGDKNMNLKTYAKESISSGQYLISETPLYDRTKAENIEMITLDKFVEDNNLEVGFIKTDLEGFEQKFLDGAVNTIKKFRPILSISIYHSYSDFFNIKSFIEKLNLGYNFKLLQCDSRKIIAETILIAEPDQTRPDQTRPDQTRPDQTN